MANGLITAAEHEKNVVSIKARQARDKVTADNAKTPLKRAQEKATAATGLLHRLTLRATHVKMSTPRTKMSKATLVEVQDNVKEMEAARKELVGLSTSKKVLERHNL